jgi:ADP-ribose pyrophosphatase YjhB (NUDIX family)
VRLLDGEKAALRGGRPALSWRRTGRRRRLLLRRRVQLPELAPFIERLRSTLASRTPVTVDRPEARRAAVALLVAESADPAILFIKRQQRLGDPWSGQMALPGGFAAASDPSLEATARRETTEETGIELGGGVATLLGALDDVSPRTPYLPPIVVRPFAFLLPDRVEPAPGPEVEAAVWLPTSQLFSARFRQPFRLTLPGEVRDFPSIVIGGYTIWGLTERVLYQLEQMRVVRPDAR